MITSSSNCLVLICRLKDVVTSEQKLYLIFEFMDRDLKAFIEQYGEKEDLDPRLIKVRFQC